jgi:hypothetical protein
MPDTPLERLAELEAAVAKLEVSDRLQVKQIRLIQKLNSALFGCIAIGLLLSQQTIQSPENRQMLERIAIGVIAAGASGLGLSGFLETKESESTE